jgi:hypothetical protein
MKKLLGGIICLLICQISQAQQTGELFQPELTFGVNAGFTLSQINFVPSVPQTLLTQNTGGFTVRYISEKNFGLQAELNYSLRGWKEKTDTVRLDDYSRSLAYIEFPLMTHLYFSMSKSARIVFNIGPQVGYFLSEKTLEEKLRSDEVPVYYNQKTQKLFDYGLTGGLGFELNTTAGSFILDGKFYYGLSTIFNSKRSDFFQASSHQVIGLRLTYLFHWSR